jgi:hypothetical protein
MHSREGKSQMSLALMSRPLIAMADTGGSATDGVVPSPRFPHLTAAEAPSVPPTPTRSPAEVPPFPEIFEEQDAERWDGMA